MNWTNSALAGVGLLAAYLPLQASSAADIDTHSEARQFVIQSTLNRFPDAVVILGDSIVEGSTLPRFVCGHAIINAGIGGASTTSDLGTMLAKSLAGKHVPLIIVSIGTNDAVMSRSLLGFRENYTALLKQISPLTFRRAVMAIPSLEGHVEIDATINQYNSILSDLAKEAGADFVLLPTMPTPHTFDGVHLNAAGYEVWDKAILQEADTVCSSIPRRSNPANKKRSD